jgi:hypothetical protein
MCKRTFFHKVHFEFDGKYLILKGTLLPGDGLGVVSLVWERLP